MENRQFKEQRDPAEEKRSNKSERPRMPVGQRAKQFAPFAAVTGLGMALRRKERELDALEKRELTDEEAREVNEVLGFLERGTEAEITYYCCGEYRSISGVVLEIDVISHRIILSTGGLKSGETVDTAPYETAPGGDTIKRRRGPGDGAESEEVSIPIDDISEITHLTFPSCEKRQI